MRTALRPALAVLLLVGCGVACCETDDATCLDLANPAISAASCDGAPCDAVAEARFEAARVAIAIDLESASRPRTSRATVDVLAAAPKTSPPVV